MNEENVRFICDNFYDIFDTIPFVDKVDYKTIVIDGIDHKIENLSGCRDKVILTGKDDKRYILKYVDNTHIHNDSLVWNKVPEEYRQYFPKLILDHVKYSISEYIESITTIYCNDNVTDEEYNITKCKCSSIVKELQKLGIILHDMDVYNYGFIGDPENVCIYDYGFYSYFDPTDLTEPKHERT